MLPVIGRKSWDKGDISFSLRIVSSKDAVASNRREVDGPQLPWVRCAGGGGATGVTIARRRSSGTRIV